MKTLLALLFSLCQLTAQSSPQVDIIPWPQEVKINSGEFSLESNARIIFTAKELEPLAQVLSQEVFQISSQTLAVAGTPPQNGDIVLRLDPTLTGEKYVLQVDDQVVITAGNYKSLAQASSSFLQGLKESGKRYFIPKLIIRDHPHSSYRSLMVDVARQPHTIDTLYQCVMLCRLYKVNFLQLHLTDDQSFTFESKAYPKLATPGRHFTQAELKELVAFADARGVTIVPEFDAPAHTTAMRVAMPELFGRPGLSVIHLGKEEVYEAMFTIADEMMEVFRSSPYFHIGADEAYFGALEKDELAIEAIKNKGYDNVHDLFLEFIVRMNEHIKSRGKQTVMWESFHGTGSRKVSIPKDIIVMAWETLYQHPQSLLDNGYTILNVSWKPTYLTPGKRWNPEYIYGWNMFRWENHWKVAPSYTPIQLEAYPNNRIIGGMMCSWESRDEMQIPGIRLRLAPLCERFWTPDGKLPYEHFANRFEHTDQVLQKLIRPLNFRTEGLTEPDYVGPFYNRENHFGDQLTLRLEPLVQDSVIHYTLDGTPPSIDSPQFTEPLVLNESQVVRAQAFDSSGKKLGFIATRPFELHPVQGEVDGLLMNVPHDEAGRGEHRTQFGDQVTISLSTPIESGTIRYTLDGSQPNGDSPEYQGPVTLTTSGVISARYFAPDNQARGAVWRRSFVQIDAETNLTTNKPVTASSAEPNGKASYAVDGIVDRDFHWDGSGGAPQWMQIDLEASQVLKRIQVITYWDGNRHYQYKVELSLDGENWNEVVDFSKNTEPATDKGFTHEFDPLISRYIRVTMLHNSANPGLHLVEVRAYTE
ncbi:family 20 glycosylhydrolase [Roseibacillus persicicus]|uniref:family 20 glycosylhydrolase n=1 Tax=Roseibacillus persicicus TaxID=454148 RepID=UPI00398B33B7